MEFDVLILGSDINAYYMSRCLHEAYGKKAHMIGILPMNFTSYSSIIDIKYEKDLQETESFKRILKEFALEHSGRKLLLIGSNDTYVRLIIENQEFLSQYYVFHRYDEELLNYLLVMERFYANFPELDKPETIIYNINDDLDIEAVEAFKYPLIVKPSDGILYHKHEFETQAKVYKIHNREELIDTVNKIRESGYDANLIIQKFIKGDDSYLFDAVAYVDRNGKCKLISFAQIALQEHTPTGIGNATVVVNGYNQFGKTKETVEKLQKFIESTGFHGFCEFDMKYDADDQKFKVLEINPRQARCSYYLCFAGYNLVKYLVEDLIEGKELPYHFIDEEVAVAFVPLRVIKDFVENEDLKNKVLDLYAAKKFVNPLKYRKDSPLKRKLWLTVRDFNYYKKYKVNNW